MIKIIGNRYQYIYYVTLFTGLRQGEVLGLTWDCVDFKSNTILINKQLRKTEKVGGKYCLAKAKHGRIRRIKLAPAVMATLYLQKDKQEKERLLAGEAWNNPWDLVFTNVVGRYLCHNTVYKYFKRIVEEMGIPEERFHDLRHTYAAISLENGDDIKTLQGNLGHAVAGFTLDTYGHITMRMRQQSADRMEFFIQKVSEN